jgi:GrpB-like predicted nucleotidyltransferase (UPF0157 family)
MTKPLSLVEYDPVWPARFDAEARRIADILGERARAIEHVGSTAVPGLAGKPVLDVSVAVESVAIADACIAPLEALGYEYRGLHGEDPRRRYYTLDGGGERIAQIHLYILPARGWHEQLAFREALRADPELARAYAVEKRRIADAVGWDKRAYSLAKDPFIQDVLARLRTAGRLAES